MSKKIIACVLGLSAALAVVGGWHLAHTRDTRQAPLAHASPPGPARTVIKQPPASDSGDSDAPSDAPFAELHGKDFTVTVSENGNELYKNLAIKLSNGTSIGEILYLSGDKRQLENELYSQADKFELVRILPHAAREQLVVKGSAALPDGYGTIGSYAIYRIDDTMITELLNVVTERDFSGLEGQAAQKFSATVTPETREGKTVIAYRYMTDKEPFKTIVFEWDGKSFVDPSGSYRHLDEKYRP
jgi:hypothetical protein